MKREILNKKPFNLNEEQIKWVEETYNSMTVDEKIGQLFIQVAGMNPQENVGETQAKYQLGGFMYRPMEKKTIFQKHKEIQEASKIPSFLAANTEKGGDGVAFEGTDVGYNMQVAATGDSNYAYKQGEIAAKEFKALGGNLSFAPVVDINMNFENPIVNLRAYSDDADTVLEMGLANTKGTQENGVAVSVKHFPGDGVDSRDQHLMPTMNHLTMEEWMPTFGKVYQGLFDAGALTTMVGHFFAPKLVEALGAIEENDAWTPTSLNKTILKKLLREKLGFNGLVLTDATTMIGMTSAMPRHEMVPTSIENGCDIFLFANNLEEDFNFMKDGLTNGLLSEERLEEAITRILATKAALGLHKGVEFNEEDIDIVGSEEHIKIKEEVREKSIHLVKDEQGMLPLSKEIKKIKLVVKREESSFPLPPGEKTLEEKIIDKFKQYGIEAKMIAGSDFFQLFAELLQGTQQAKDDYDAVVIFGAYGPYSNAITQRVSWGLMGADGPKMIHDIPTMFVSLGTPYHLFDVPMIKTMVNAWTSDDQNLDILFKKIMGESEFIGKSPVETDVRFPLYKK